MPSFTRADQRSISTPPLTARDIVLQHLGVAELAAVLLALAIALAGTP